MAGIGQIFKALGLLIPLPVLAVLVGVLAIAMGPAWVESIRHKQIRGLVRRLIRADPDERARLEHEIFALCDQRVGRWSSLLYAADHYGRVALRDVSLVRLEELGAKDLVRRWRASQDQRGAPRVRDPVQALVRIERLFHSGLTEAGDAELAEARRMFPEDDDLRRLAESRAKSIVRPPPAVQLPAVEETGLSSDPPAR